MTCHNCRTECRKFGKRANRQRYQCSQCRKVFTDARDNTLDGMYLPVEKAEMVLRLLLEGNSVSSVVRLTEVHQKTILKLLVLAGEKCERLLEEKIQNLSVQDVECDELWSYVAKKEGHKRPDEFANEAIGDAYTFVAIEHHTKLVLAWHLGQRKREATMLFARKLKHAVNPQHWFQITTDGFPPYTEAIDYQFGSYVDYAKLIKVYRAPSEGEGRYSPAEVSKTEVVPVIGNPRPERICTSIVERQNLSVRMGTRRLTRLTNAFSKKWENHWAALACWFAFYNFCRIHKTLRCTPAMEAGIADHIWSVRELLEAA